MIIFENVRKFSKVFVIFLIGRLWIGFFSSGGYLDNTSQFWLIYIEIISIRNMRHTTVQLNEFGLRVDLIKYSLPLIFYYNMQN